MSVIQGIRKFSVASLLFLAVSMAASAQEHRWYSHAEVVKKVIQTFQNLHTYSSAFYISTVDGNKTRNMSGTVFYQKPGKLRFDFNSPDNDLIVSDGKILWIFMKRLNAVGKQNLALDIKDENGRNIFMKNPGSGLSRLFNKYHYRFDTVDQPRTDEDGTFFVLDLDQREKVGGYETIKLFVDAKSYLIRKAIATDGFGRKTTIQFTGPRINPQLEGKLFQYKPDDSVRVVSNPLVNE